MSSLGGLMDYDVVEARYVGGHVVWLRFRDGTSGEVDLSAELSSSPAFGHIKAQRGKRAQEWTRRASF
jgi:hypothetical protein